MRYVVVDFLLSVGPNGQPRRMEIPESVILEPIETYAASLGTGESTGIYANARVIEREPIVDLGKDIATLWCDGNGTLAFYPDRTVEGPQGQLGWVDRCEGAPEWRVLRTRAVYGHSGGFREAATLTDAVFDLYGAQSE